jgi:hypothetical protein
MPALTAEEKLKQKTLYELSYNYLISNFSKFKQAQQIKVALDVIGLFNKDGSKSSGERQIVFVVNSGGELPREIPAKSAGNSPHHFEVLPAQIPADNPGISDKV